MSSWPWPMVWAQDNVPMPQTGKMQPPVIAARPIVRHAQADQPSVEVSQRAASPPATNDVIDSVQTTGVSHEKQARRAGHQRASRRISDRTKATSNSRALMTPIAARNVSMVRALPSVVACDDSWAGTVSSHAHGSRVTPSAR